MISALMEFPASIGRSEMQLAITLRPAAGK